MVNIGLLGDISVGKTSILRLFVRYLKVGDIEKVKGGQKCTVIKTDFSGEATIPGGDKEDTLNQDFFMYNLWKFNKVVLIEVI